MAKLKFTKMSAFPGFPAGLSTEVRGYGTVEMYYLGDDRVSIELAGSHKILAIVDNMDLAKKQLQQINDMDDSEREARIARQTKGA